MMLMKVMINSIIYATLIWMMKLMLIWIMYVMLVSLISIMLIFENEHNEVHVYNERSPNLSEDHVNIDNESILNHLQ